MEKELFHEHLEKLYETFGKETVFITLNQAAKYCKKDPRTLEADKTFPVKRLARGAHTTRNVALINFARWLAA